MKYWIISLIPFIITANIANAAVVQLVITNEECIGTIMVHVNDTISWINYDDKPHYLTSVDEYDHANGLLNGKIDPNKAINYKFSEERNFEYYCTPSHKEHAWIKVVEKNIVSDTEPKNYNIIDDKTITEVSTASKALKVYAKTSVPEKGKEMTLNVNFVDSVSNQLISHVEYALIILQDGIEVPLKSEVYQSNETMVYTTKPLKSEKPLVIQVRILDIRLPNAKADWNVQNGETVTFQITGKRSQELDISEYVNGFEFPKWFMITLKWHEQKEVTDNELLDAIKFLISQQLAKSK